MIMIRCIGNCIIQATKSSKFLKASTRVNPKLIANVRHFSKNENYGDSDSCFLEFLNSHDIDVWDVRKTVRDLLDKDAIPEPKIIIAALKACQRVHDYALIVQILENVRHKCESKAKEIYPYIIHEINPTLEELGVGLPTEQKDLDK